MYLGSCGSKLDMSGKLNQAGCYLMGLFHGYDVVELHKARSRLGLGTKKYEVKRNYVLP